MAASAQSGQPDVNYSSLRRILPTCQLRTLPTSLDLMFGDVVPRPVDAKSLVRIRIVAKCDVFWSGRGHSNRVDKVRLAGEPATACAASDRAAQDRLSLDRRYQVCHAFSSCKAIADRLTVKGALTRSPRVIALMRTGDRNSASPSSSRWARGRTELEAMYPNAAPLSPRRYGPHHILGTSVGTPGSARRVQDIEHRGGKTHELHRLLDVELRLV